MSLTPRGMSVQEAYRLYASSKLSVNRRYQRKLVWSSKEKKHLINSVQNELPIPLFMFAKFDDEDDRLEIIDGMQRLNAIFSFIEHQFADEEGLCFDLEQSTRAQIELKAGRFEEFGSETPRMDADQCAKFLEYQLAVTIDSDGNEERINDVFSRINSGGRQLSPQEQRQAGLVSEFSEFVRKLAFKLRGDSSPDILTLNEMPEVSFDTPREKQRYGIDAAEVFWCKHGIIVATDLARSEDEQLIADLAISILNDTPLNASREVFDSHFQKDSDNFAAINAALLAYGSERLGSEIVSTIGSIRAAFETDGFTSFRNCVHERPRNPARTTFFAVFFAFHRLMSKQGMYADDLSKIKTALEDSQKLMIRSAHHSTTDDRERNIAVIQGLIQDAFIKKDVAAFGGAHALVVDLENSLRRAKYEASRYEFKVGVCRLSVQPTLDLNMYKKLARTACAIANTHPGQDGFIYLGVADNKEASDRICKQSGQDAIEIGKVFFVGLQSDLATLELSIEDYVKKLLVELAKEPLAEPLKTQLATTIDHAEYQGRPFVRMRIPAQANLTEFGGQYPVRKNSETVDLTPVETLAQAKLFKI